MTAASISPQAERASTGIAGLDDILGGGLPKGRSYLVEGHPGAGKTTLSLQFLIEGVRKGEPVLYFTLSESRDELLDAAASHGLSLEGVEIRELLPTRDDLNVDEQNTMFHPAEVELSETIRRVLDEVEASRPMRIVLDSLSELKLVAESHLRFRRQILALKHYFSERRSTVLLLEDQTVDAGGGVLQSIVHGVLTLHQLAPEYGAERRRLRIQKLRGSDFRGGYHDYVIRRGGLQVFPRLVAAEHHMAFERGIIKSGVEGLDTLLGGGPDRGTSTLVTGPAGVGKSVIASLYAVEANCRGERSVVFSFDESLETFLERSEGLGIPARRSVDAGLLSVQQVDPAELAPNQFAQSVRDAVERGGARVVVIDSLNGYFNAMPAERYLILQLHELLSYLGQLGVVTFLIAGQAGMIGPTMRAPVDTSYLADTVILLRFYEDDGEIRRALSVVKKRRGAHESTIRRLVLSASGIHVDEPLRGYEGVLTGVPKRPTPSRPGGEGDA